MQTNSEIKIPIASIGISHKTAGVEIRDRVALNAEEQKFTAGEIMRLFNVDGCLIISTCNRTEVYVSGEKSEDRMPEICIWLNEYKKCSYFTDAKITYRLNGSKAVRHFFEVVSGLDSQIIGEPQITGQVKDSYNLAHDSSMTDTILNKLFNFGLQAEKKVRSETFLSDGAVSVSFAGVELARKIFNNLNDKTVLLIGAGETAELAAIHFLEKGVKELYIANRTYENAKKLASKLGGRAFGLQELPAALTEADIVISATSSNNHVVTRDIMLPVFKERYDKPMFLIDLAIPRDIDPAVDKIEGVYLYNLDNLQEIVQMNLDKRKQEIPKASKIIDEYVHDFQKWISSHSVSFIIKRLKAHFDRLRIKELDRLRKRLPVNGFEEIDYLTQSIMNKLMHQHIKALKKIVNNPELYQQQVEFILDLYELEDE
ncbi:MAG TPA: glutamyl-tRNA reductase [Caldithrix abyssi]|uniref:Glutamyl-tRNA reductase n=1 Tax=Caldithrix abyssi TaxID=187145 RepID=A0A7V4U0U8_CALAY|nr:glutamyl-tRNA reductase [Caldithrix abyssi]